MSRRSRTPSSMSVFTVVAVTLVSTGIAWAETSNSCHKGTISCSSGASVSGDTSTSECRDEGNTASPEVTYTLQVSSDTGGYDDVTRVFLDTCGSGFDTLLHVYNSDGIEITTCNDCGSCEKQVQLTVMLTPGNYTVLLEGSGSESGAYVLSTTCSAPTTEGVIHCGDTVSGTTAIGSQDTLGQPSNEHIYAVVIDEDRAEVTFDSCASRMDTYLHVFDNAMLQQLTFCDDCGPCGLKAVVTTVLTRGIYNLGIEGYLSAEGRYSVTTTCADPPDTSLAYQGPITCGQTVTGNTRSGSQTLGSSSAEHHYSFVIPPEQENRNITFTTCNSAFDTLLRIYNDDLTHQLRSCDDCGNCEYRSVLRTTLQAGSYNVVIEGYQHYEGEYEMTMLCGENATAFSESSTDDDSGEADDSYRARVGRVTGLIFAGLLGLLLILGVAAMVEQRARNRRNMHLARQQQGNHHDMAVAADAVPPAYSPMDEGVPVYDDVMDTPHASPNRPVRVPENMEMSPSYAEASASAPQDMDEEGYIEVAGAAMRSPQRISVQSAGQLSLSPLAGESEVEETLLEPPPSYDSLPDKDL